MTKKVFIKSITVSSVVVLISIALSIGFFVAMYHKYAPPTENNTYVITEKITEVYRTSPKTCVIISLQNGECLELVYPFLPSALYSEIGYNADELSELLEGKTVQIRRMKRLDWALEIRAGDTVIDNVKLTNKTITVNRIGIWIIGVMLIVIIVSFQIIFLTPRYKRYKRAEKKRMKREKQKLLKKLSAYDKM